MNKKQFILLAFCICGGVHAQEKTNDIEQIELHARPKVKKEREEFKKNAQATEVISDYELNRNNPAFIEQSLNNMAGIQVEKRSQVGGQRIIVRGYGNDQKFNNWGVKMYLNNIPLTGADGITILDDINFSAVNQVEIIKGPAATLYGGGTGGAVRFYSNPETRKGRSLTQQFMAGSFGLFQSSTTATDVGNTHALSANYSHFGSDGYRPHGASNKNTYGIVGDFKVNERQKISLLATHSNSLEQISGQISYDDYYNGVDNGNFSYIRRGAKTKFINSRLGIGHRWNFAKGWDNQTTLFFSEMTGERIAAGAFENSSSPNYGIRSVFTMQKRWDDFLSATEFGVEYQQSRAQITNLRYKSVRMDELPVLKPLYNGSSFKYLNQQTNYFAVQKFTYQPWNLMVLGGVSLNQLAYDREDLLAFPGLFVVNGKDLYNKDLSFGKEFKMVATPHFAVQKTWKDQIINLSYSEGYNAPTSATAFVTGLNKANDNLLPERAKMWDFSIHGLLADQSVDYQFSVFTIDIMDKLSQLRGTLDNFEKTPYSYWANTGDQRNKGIELSVGYVYKPLNGFISKLKPFINGTYNNFKYSHFSTYLQEAGMPAAVHNYDNKNVVGVPVKKLAAGLDVDTHLGIYWQSTFNYMGSVYTDFANKNEVRSFGLLNSKIGFKTKFHQFDIDAFIAGNNLTNQINYTFLFYGNSINDSDPDNQYQDSSVFTDVNPGPNKAYFFSGLNVRYNF